MEISTVGKTAFTAFGEKSPENFGPLTTPYCEQVMFWGSIDYCQLGYSKNDRLILMKFRGGVGPVRK